MKTLFVTAIVVLVAVILDVVLLHHQATRGKLPFKIKLFPDFGS